jgi:16S rRNA (guanine527-N7)-methyltransferase
MEETTPRLEIILKYFSDFTPRQLAQLTALEALYTDWNSKINVISRKDIESLYEKHVLHSLSIAAVTDFSPGMEVIDIGTGGGFPGIPLAIFFPELRFHLVDSIGKKLKVVEAVATALELTNVTVQHTRVEAITKRQFDFAVSRAVAPLADLWKWAQPVLRKKPLVKATAENQLRNGLICLKGGDLAAEISQSGLRPVMWELDKLFEEEWFTGKYALYVPVSG